jgi:hypothetical protein
MTWTSGFPENRDGAGEARGALQNGSAYEGAEGRFLRTWSSGLLNSLLGTSGPGGEAGDQEFHHGALVHRAGF